MPLPHSWRNFPVIPDHRDTSNVAVPQCQNMYYQTFSHHLSCTMKYLQSMFLLLGLLLLLDGCAGAQESADNDRDAPRKRRAATVSPAGIDLGLAIPESGVATIQLFPFLPGRSGAQGEGREDELPVLPLRGRQQLKLAFDLLEGEARPLSVYFYHANREWRRDLIASEYLTSFQRDDLLDYNGSIGTQFDYVHYDYTFPNRDIGFRISGNYILRVTEQGQEDAVLFELPFFVTEEATSVDFALDNVLVPGQQYASIQPIISFTPPSTLASNVFDYNVCFVRNGQFGGTRCSDRPSLTRQPDLLFDLEPRQAFEPQGGDYFLDLSSLNVGGSIEDVDFSTRPIRVLLEPDYAKFPSSSTQPLLNGQSVIAGAVRNVGNPAVEAEYAQVHFSYVPPNEQPLSGGVMITGSFNGWSFDLANQLTWVAERGRYEGAVLIKQGLYEYRYSSRDARARRALRNNLPRSDNLYTAFVYFADTSLQTDRLLATRGVRTQ